MMGCASAVGNVARMRVSGAYTMRWASCRLPRSYALNKGAAASSLTSKIKGVVVGLRMPESSLDTTAFLEYSQPHICPLQRMASQVPAEAYTLTHLDFTVTGAAAATTTVHARGC
jgi:hypothetical protein